MVKLIRGVLSAAVLVLLLVVPPIALGAAAGHVDWPGSGSEAWVELTTASTTNPLLAPFLLVVGAVAWLHFAVATVMEFTDQLLRRERRLSRYKPLGESRIAVSGLVAAVLAVLMLAAPAGSAAAATMSGPLAAAPAQMARSAAVTATRATPSAAVAQPRDGAGSLVVTVRSGDTLQSLAAKHLGSPEQWPAIWNANRGVLSSYDTIPIGAQLRVPGHTVTRAVATGTGGTVKVRAGDTLRGLAAAHLGDADRWPQLQAANRGLITDPDLIEVGWTLHLPHTATAETTPTPAHHAASPPATSPARAQQPPPRQVPAQRSAPLPVAPTTSAAPSPGPRAQRVAPVAPAVTAGPSAPRVEAPVPPGVVTAPDPAPGATAAPAPAATAQDDTSSWVWRATAGGLMVLAAAGVLALLARRRRWQASKRQPGRRIPMPPAEDREAELEAMVAQEPDAAAWLNGVLRAIAAQAAAAGRPLPALLGLTLDSSGATLVLSQPETRRPGWVTVPGPGTWRIERAAVPAELLATPAPEAHVQAPWPALVTLGRTTDTQHLLLLNLEAARALTLTVDPADPGAAAAAEAVLAGMAIELANSCLADHLVVHLVGWGADLAPLGINRFQHHDSLAAALPVLSGYGAADRAVLNELGAKDLDEARAVPDQPDLLATQVVLCATPPVGDDLDRLTELLEARPQIAVAAVTTARPDDTWTDPSWSMRITSSYLTDLPALQVHLEMQRSEPGERAQLVALAEAALSTEDRPAPTVEALTNTSSTPATEEPTTAEPELEPELDLESAGLVDEPGSVQLDDADSDEADSARPDGAGPADPVVAEQDSELHPDGDLASSDPRAATVDPALVKVERAVDPVAVAPTTPRPPQTPRRARLPLTNALDKLAGSPQIRILGDLDVVGATGQLSRGGGGRFLLLFGTYIALHPGRTHLDVDAALWPHATGDNNSARNSAMSKLRLWIGQAPDGEMWLPRATATDGYHWHRDFLPLDWQHFLKLEARGARGDDDALLRALSLVRGRPLGNLIRSPHPWVDDLREEATARVVDVAHQLVQRSLANGNTVVAAQAIRAGMLAEPAAEILHQDAIRAAAVEHNTAKLHGAIDRAYRALDDDLSRDTIDLIAQVTESTGGVRVAAS